MKCVENLKRHAANMGATVDDDYDNAIYVDAPRGYCWDSSTDATLAYDLAGGFSVACKSLLKMMREGLYKCSNEDSERIGHDRNEDWVAPNDAPDVIKFA